MSRVQGTKTTQNDHPCGRLVVLDNSNFDAVDLAEGTMSFLCPSESRKDLVYQIVVCMRSAQASCPCEAMSANPMDGFRNAHKMPYRFSEGATYAEAIAKGKAIRFEPQITRAPSKMCGHLRKVRSALRRRGLWPLILAAEQHAIEVLEAAPDLSKRKAT